MRPSICPAKSCPKLKSIFLDEVEAVSQRKTAFLESLAKNAEDGLIGETLKTVKYDAFCKDFFGLFGKVKPRIAGDAYSYIRGMYLKSRLELASKAKEASDADARKVTLQQLADVADAGRWFEARGEAFQCELAEYFRKRAKASVQELYDAAQAAARHAGRDVELI